MKHDFQTYGILAGVFLLSIGGCYLVPAQDVLKAVVAAPGIMALLAVLFQLIRDQAAYERQLEIQQKQMQFTLGAASHMANTAFDKHVEFCEMYMEEIHCVVCTLLREGETTETLKHAGNLASFREKYAVWLTNEINSNLEAFEAALLRLGANTVYVQKTYDKERYKEQCSIKSDNALKLFIEILGLKTDDDFQDEYAAEAIKLKVKNILGIEELTALRKHLVNEASKVLNST